MYIFADESGSTGRNLFDRQEWYYQGAILCKSDPSDGLGKIVTKWNEKLSTVRLHATDMHKSIVVEIAEEILDYLDDNHIWEYYLGAIHKPYQCACKFVDLVFDSGENKGAHWLWYNFEPLRHKLCLVVDEMLTPQNRENFWQAFLSDNVNEIKKSIRNAYTYLHRVENDQRVRKVVKDGFDCALRFSDELTFSVSSRRDSYKIHTPNMIGFSGLHHRAHQFSEKNKSRPVAFVHDQQSEFGKSMKQFHKFFGRTQLIDKKGGLPPLAKINDYDLGQFSTPSSKENTILQAVDILLWLLQRKDDREISGIKKRIYKNVHDNSISGFTSNQIVKTWMYKLRMKELSAQGFERAKEFHNSLEEVREDNIMEMMADR